MRIPCTAYALDKAPRDGAERGHQGTAMREVERLRHREAAKRAAAPSAQTLHPLGEAQ